MKDYTLTSQLENDTAVLVSERYAATIVTRIIDRYLSPNSILDLGCGNGVWLDILSDDGQRQVQGVEEEAFAPLDLVVNPTLVTLSSVSRPLELDRTFDLVLCLNAPEIFKPQFADALIDNCCRHGDVILFGAGSPSQAMISYDDNIACSLCVELFRKQGYVDLDLVRPLLWHDARIPFRYRQGLLLFVKREFSRLPYLKAEATRMSGFSPLIRMASFAAGLDWQRFEEVGARLAWQADYSGRTVADLLQAREETHRLTGELARAMAAQQAYQEESRARAVDLQRAGDALQFSQDEVRSLNHDLEHLRQRAQDLQEERQSMQRHIDDLGSYVESLQRDMAVTVAELERTERAVAVLRQERTVILGSTIWRATAPLRAIGRAIPLSVRMRLRKLLVGIPRLIRTAGFSQPKQRDQGREPTGESANDSNRDLAPTTPSRRRIVIISGESHTPGHVYRVLRLAEVLNSCGETVSWLRLEDYDRHREEIRHAKVVFIWRAPYSALTAGIMKAARAAGAKVVFDLDDLMLKPELATVDIIDGIRSQRFDASETARLFARVQKMMLMADLCTCTTNELAGHIREYQKVAFVLPNGFDEAAHMASRLAVRHRRVTHHETTIRIGYASGSRTHQRDFGQLADGIARLLLERSDCLLVLFRDPISLEPVLHPGEFPALATCVQQIEWRDMVPLDLLPQEIARFDINLVPLEIGNPFCEAKSELKYFEAALVEVCSAASRTGPMERVIRDRVNGLLIGTVDAWYDGLRELAANQAMRHRMGHAAYLDVLWRFGPQRRAELVVSLLDQLSGGEAAARAFELELRRTHRPVPSFDFSQSSVIFISDNQRASEVCVILPLHNYAHYVGEALESVRRQTIRDLDLVIVEDCSTDNSMQVALDWSHTNAERFNRLVVIQNQNNAGLARSRNVGFDAAETPYILPLDADNRLLSECCEVLLRALQASRAAFAYPRIQCFGDASHIIGEESFSPARFSGGNYIDAMALIGKWAWAAVGGYAHIQNGWEDYDFWCRCVEHGFWGVQVPEVLAEYRVHQQSMLKTRTDHHENKLKLIRELNAEHTWLSIPYRM
jgi:SAM-dependent methyltransferase/TolA-binding protein